jgi:hypothetical protein
LEPKPSVRVLFADRESVCVPENFTKRDIALFVLAFGVAGCLMAWSINLSIDRLLFADLEPKTSEPKTSEPKTSEPKAPARVHIQVPRQAPIEYREARGQ